MIGFNSTLLVAAIGGALAFGAGWTANGNRLEREIAEIRAEQAEELAKATQRALAQYQEEVERIEEARKNAERQAKINAAAAAGARRESDGLRAQLTEAQRRLSTSTCASVRNYATTLTTVLDQCRAVAQDVAKNADGHALDERTLREAVTPRKKE